MKTIPRAWGRFTGGTAVVSAPVRINAMCAQRQAIYSALFGCVPEVLFESSPVVIIYLAMLDGGDGFAMFSSAIPGLALTLLLIPGAGLVNRIGLKRSVGITCYVSATALLLIALAPLFGKNAAARLIVIAGCFMLAFMRPLFTAAWFPILDDILKPEERDVFFGRMRFYYMALTTLLLFGFGTISGKKLPIWMMQLFFLMISVMAMGRKMLIDRIPIREDNAGSAIPQHKLKKALQLSMRNSALTGFSIYVMFLTFAVMAYPPLVFIYLKTGLKAGDNTIMIIAALQMGGTLLGYLFIGKLLNYCGTKPVQIAVHLAYLGVLIGLTFCGNYPWSIAMIGLLMLIGGFCYACYFVYLSVEMLALARPDNRTMTVALCNTFHYAGGTLSRLGGAMMLGSGMMATQWSIKSTEFSNFQTILLFFGGCVAFSLITLMLVPSAVSLREDYYKPPSRSFSTRKGKNILPRQINNEAISTEKGLVYAEVQNPKKGG